MLHPLLGGIFVGLVVERRGKQHAAPITIPITRATTMENGSFVDKPCSSAGAKSLLKMPSKDPCYLEKE